MLEDVEQSQASFFQTSGINLPIQLSARKRTCVFPKMSNCFFNIIPLRGVASEQRRYRDPTKMQNSREVKETKTKNTDNNTKRIVDCCCIFGCVCCQVLQVSGSLSHWMTVNLSKKSDKRVRITTHLFFSEQSKVNDTAY